MFRFAQHDKGPGSSAVACLSKVNRLLATRGALRALLFVFIVTALVFSALPFLRYLRGGTTFDYKLWYATGQHVLAGHEIYFFRSGKYDFMYPPPCALFLALASLLGQGGLILLLVAINSAAWSCSARFSAVLAGGMEGARKAWLYLIPNLLVIVYVWSSYHLGQPSLVLLALMLAAFVALRARQEILAGGLIAVAAAIKAFPILAIIYLLYRRYWIAAASLAVTLVFLILILPAPFRGFEQACRDIQKWSAGMLIYSEAKVGQRPMRSYTWKNQSLIGVSNRLLRHVDADAASAPHKPIYVNVADLKFSTVNAIVVSVALALGLVFMVVMPRRDARTAESDAFEFSLLLLLMLMITPLSFGYFYSWLMLPFAVLTQRLVVGKASAGLWWSLAALVLLAVGLIRPRGAQFYGNTLFATLLLFIGLSIELWRFKRQSLTSSQSEINRR
jgi:Glycosyltransferase family 87